MRHLEFTLRGEKLACVRLDLDVIAQRFGLDHILLRIGHRASRINEDEPRTQVSLAAKLAGSLWRTPHMADFEPQNSITCMAAMATSQPIAH
jgi:hypothetical protein